MFGLFKKAQPHKLSIEGVGEITVEPKETILTAALRQGIKFPHSCKVGGCATCKCKLEKGQVKELTSAAFILSEEELTEGYILGCQSQLRTDASIRVNALVDQDNAPEAVAGKITEKKQLTHDIVQLNIELDKETKYQAGQYAMLSTSQVSSGSRCYSYAAPANGHQISFFIRQVPDGEMSGWANLSAKVGDKVTIDGPYGDFYLRAGSGTLLMVAGGSGLAPVMAILEDALTYKTTRDVIFLFGARTEQDLYCLDEIEKLRQNWSGSFKFIPVLSQEPENSSWQGQRGWVTDVLPTLLDNSDSPIEQTYMCGPPPMLDRVEIYLKDNQISEGGIFCDRFLDRSHTQQQNAS